MARTVNEAFGTFMKDFVRLDPDRTDTAKKSKSYLVSEIEKFPNDGKFFLMYLEFSSIDYGSFSRKTKIRELDDIDIMIVLHAEGNWRRDIQGGFEICIPNEPNRYREQCNSNTNILNSIKVVNCFKDYLREVPSYEMANIKRNQEAATLKLKSYEWIYDIVPCFMTAPDEYGKTFFLIPDGKGNWKPTDPRIDKQRTISVINKQTVSVLDMVRIMKYWTKRPTMPTMKSYFLENLILNYYDSYGVTTSAYIPNELPRLIGLVFYNVHQPLYDPKGYQGDINHLTYEERESIQNKAETDHAKAKQALQLESEGKQKDAITLWGEIFGPDFPTYSF